MKHVFIQPKKGINFKTLKKEVDSLGLISQETDKDNTYKMDPKKFPVYVKVPESMAPLDFIRYQGRLLGLKSIMCIEFKMMGTL